MHIHMHRGIATASYTPSSVKIIINLIEFNPSHRYKFSLQHTMDGWGDWLILYLGKIAIFCARITVEKKIRVKNSMKTPIISHQTPRLIKNIKFCVVDNSIF